MNGKCIVDGCSDKAIKKKMCDKHYSRVRKYGDPYIYKRVVGDDKKRFLESFVVSCVGCWEWSKRTHEKGYGVFHLKGKLEQAHRAAWIIINGPIPEGLYVLHKCNNRKCVNPDHLYLGTHQDNMNDMVRDKRSNKPYGERNGKSKITTEQAKRIKESPGSPMVISREMMVSIHIVRDIKRGITWKHA
jgi:hypothetical protein